MATHDDLEMHNLPINAPEIFALGRQLSAIKAQVVAAGGFAGDREPHTCPKCGLQEDVLCGGLLVTYWPHRANPTDTGLRFTEANHDQLICPACGAVSDEIAIEFPLDE